MSITDQCECCHKLDEAAHRLLESKKRIAALVAECTELEHARASWEESRNHSNAAYQSEREERMRFQADAKHFEGESVKLRKAVSRLAEGLGNSLACTTAMGTVELALSRMQDMNKMLSMAEKNEDPATTGVDEITTLRQQRDRLADMLDLIANSNTDNISLVRAHRDMAKVGVDGIVRAEGNEWLMELRKQRDI